MNVVSSADCIWAMCVCVLQLTFRTVVRDFSEPNCNSDFLAAKFRDELMPARGKLHRQRSPLIKINRVSMSVCV